MSDHLPLARPAGPVSTGDPPLSAAWVARYPLWDAYFAVLTVAVGVAVATSTPPAAPYRVGSVALLATISVWYAAFGRALMRYGIKGWRAYLYLGVALALYVPAVALASSASFALFVLLPQAFMLLPTMPAVGAVVLFTAVQVVLDWLRFGAGPDVRGALLAALMVAVVVSVTGGWVQHLFVDADRRAALVDELAASRDEVARLSRQAGVDAERQRLAGEIHDTIAQGLSSVVMLIQAADAELDRDAGQARRHLALAVTTARANLAEARALVAALTPAELAGSPLVEAVRRVVGRFTAESGVPVTLAAPGTQCPLPTSVEVVLLRVTQEALANARKHAAAGRVEVRLERQNDVVVLEVRDDGRGFTTPPAGDGYGLAGMRNRVEQVAGTLRVASSPGAGTTVRAEVPIR
ncbi:sensor histidine kinase [Micromonospora sp. U56]|uniref:sensor histidine kinase n=1 Tax=Micromonospora sp. U56 TaxID=2824900 RepID=UPI0027DD81A4|nr:sensor histidine kinase [Micromonospora sp. U56]